MASNFPLKLTWIFFVLAVGSLITAGIYLGKSLNTGYQFFDVFRTIIFSALGIIWILMFSQGRTLSYLQKTERSE